jgi:RNA polymerase sigma-70 factor (ECF subfamily)
MTLSSDSNLQFGAWRADVVQGPPRVSWPELVVLVRRQMRSLVGPARDVEDLTQAALEQIVRSIDRFEGRCELSTYTYRIASRVAMNHWRSLRRYLRRFVLGTEDVAEPSEPSDGNPERLQEHRRAARLHHHLDRLSPEHRLVVVLADLEELPASRIAEIMECPEATVRSRLKRARADLAKRLARDPLFAEEVKR